MGCATSKLELGEELPPALCPIRRQIEEVKRRRIERHLSGVSITEPLRRAVEVEPANIDDVAAVVPAPAPAPASSPTSSQIKEAASVSDPSTGSCPTTDTTIKTEKRKEEIKKEAAAVGVKKSDHEKVAAAEESTEKKKEVEEEEEEKTKAAVAAAAVATNEDEHEEKKREEVLEEEEKRRQLGAIKLKGNEEDGLPGSPSFRFYFNGSVDGSEDGSIVFFGQPIKNTTEELNGTEKNETVQVPEDNTKSLNSSDQDTELKQLKEKKGKKLRALTTAPVAVCHLLNVRNCYSQPTTAAHVESPRCVVGGAA